METSVCAQGDSSPALEVESDAWRMVLNSLTEERNVFCAGASPIDAWTELCITAAGSSLRHLLLGNGSMRRDRIFSSENDRFLGVVSPDMNVSDEPAQHPHGPGKPRGYNNEL